MELLWKYKRDAGTVTYLDYERFPIWTLDEDDFGNTYEIPVSTAAPLDITDLDLMISVLCSLELHDGTIMKGAIHIDLRKFLKYGLTAFSTYGLRVFKNGDEFSLTPRAVLRYTPKGSAEDLSRWLNKPLDAITPIRYRAPFEFRNGQVISGELDLHTW